MHLLIKFKRLCHLHETDEKTAMHDMEISKTTLTNWLCSLCNGESIDTTVRTAHKMSKYFDVPISYFLKNNEISYEDKIGFLLFCLDKFNFTDIEYNKFIKTLEERKDGKQEHG